MFRSVATRLSSAAATAGRSYLYRAPAAVMSVRQSHGVQETDEEFDAKYESYFSRPDITGWEVRKAMNDLAGEDLVPEPRIIIACMHACRRLNDYALAVRFLEYCKYKCGPRVGEIWPYVVQEVSPTVKELGLSFPDDMGYEKPELACEDTLDWH